MNSRTAAVIDEIGRHREQFERWCRSLSEEELGRPVPDSNWRVQDFISHLATIDTTVSVWFAAIADGSGLESAMEGHPDEDKAGEGERFEIDTWNDAQVAERRDWSLDQIFAEATQTRVAIVRQLARLGDTELDSTIQFGGDSKRAASAIKLIDYLTGWAKHDPIHVNDMIRALPERRQDADVRSWLDDPVVGGIARGYATAMGWEKD